jgi:uracil-DNA glycosylase family 4
MIERPKNCAGCPFKSRTVGTRGKPDARIVLVGEGPGTNEIIQGMPFVGQSGELLARLLGLAKIDLSDCLLLNATQCLPPKSLDANGKEVKAARLNEACQACNSRLFSEIQAHPRDFILSLGSAATRTLTGKWGLSIMKTRGQVFQDPTLSRYGIMPTFHPAYALRSPGAVPQITSDFRRAKELSTGNAPYDPEVEFKILRNAYQIKLVVEQAKQSGENEIVADIETTGLSHVTDEIMCIGFTFKNVAMRSVELRQKTLVYVVENQKHTITSPDTSTPSDNSVLKSLFTQVNKLRFTWTWQNGKFDTKFLRHSGIDAQVDDDTMLMSYTLDENGGRHGLEAIITDQLGLPAYKDMISEYVGTGKKKKSYGLIPKPLLYTYLAKDVVYTAMSSEVLMKKLIARSHTVIGSNNPLTSLLSAYRNLLIPASNALCSIELRGMPIDQEVRAKAQVEFEVTVLEHKLKLQQLVGDLSFNPNSSKQVLETLKTRGLRITETGKEALLKYEDDPVVEALLEYRGYQKILSTYLKAFAKYGNRVYTSYLLHATVTGRLSSKDPNLQNIPKLKVARAYFKTRKGRRLVAFDYSQAELRSLAVQSNDKTMIQIFKDGKDLHTEVAASVYGAKFTREAKYLPNANPKIKIENPVFAELRRNAKTINFGIVYGVTPRTLMRRLGITLDAAETLVNGWFALFPEAKRFMDWCRNAPASGIPITTCYGRKRRFHLLTDGLRNGQENEAGNFPHQSMCSDFTLDSCIEIDRIQRTVGLPGNAFQVNIIHDDNTFECDDDIVEIRKLANIVRPIMEAVPVKMGITSLPFQSDAKHGLSWDKMEELEF